MVHLHFVLLLILYSFAPISVAENADQKLIYSARMAMLNAGDLTLQYVENGSAFEVLGRFKTSKSLSKYYTWNGVFVSKARRVDERITTDAYLTISSSSDDPIRLVVYTPDEVRVLDDNQEEVESRDIPKGSDLISALFFVQGCYDQPYVNDGEDHYPIKLKTSWTSRVNMGLGFYEGEVINCRYRVADRKGRRRTVEVAMANTEVGWRAVRVQIKIPMLPDPVLRLRWPVGTSS